MNIKSVGGIPLPIEIKKTERRLQDSSADRDAMPQQDSGADSQNKKMSQEEAQQAIEHLKSLDGIKDNNLNVRLEKSGDIFIVLIEDYTGKVVRRIPENELWFLTREKSKSKGHLFDKAM